MKEKILVVDDTYTNRFLAEKILIKNGYDVVHTNNGFDAIKIFNEIIFNLVITDIKMPIMDGVVFAKKIVEIKKVPIFALTAKKSSEFDLTLFDAYLRIPYKTNEFLDVVKNLIEKKNFLKIA